MFNLNSLLNKKSQAVDKSTKSREVKKDQTVQIAQVRKVLEATDQNLILMVRS